MKMIIKGKNLRMGSKRRGLYIPNIERLKILDTRECDIGLAVFKGGSPNIYESRVECSSLGLVDCDSIGEFQRNLLS
jgi:hypothetical protein